jgi:hypothetical protein
VPRERGPYVQQEMIFDISAAFIPVPSRSCTACRW